MSAGLELAVTDRELLAAYQRRPSPELFGEMVRRHVNLVYSVARRLAGEGAADVSQEVFLALLKKAPELDAETPLAGWLYTAARLAALAALRSAARRQRLEREVAMGVDESESPDVTWSLIAGEVDAAVAELEPGARHALVLRYFAGKSNGEIAADLAISEEAAKKRVQRAVESLRGLLAGRGYAVELSGLSAALAVHGIGEAAPATLAGVITHAGMQVTGTAAKAATGLKGAVMAGAKAKAAAAIIGGVVLAVSVPVAVVALQRAEGRAAGGGAAPVAAGMGQTVVAGADVPGGSSPSRPLAAAAPVDPVEALQRIYGLAGGQVIKRIGPSIPDGREEALAAIMAGGPQNAFVNDAALAQTIRAAGGAGAPARPMVVPGSSEPRAVTAGAPMPGGAANPVDRRIGLTVTGPDGVAESRAPSRVMVRWNGALPMMAMANFTLGGDGFTVQDLLQTVFGRGIGPMAQEVDGDEALLGMRLPGDFAYRADAATEDLRAGVEKMLTDELGIRVKLEFKDVPMPVYVLKGTWSFKPVNPSDDGATKAVHVYDRDMSVMVRGVVVPMEAVGRFLENDYLKTRVVIEAEGAPRGVRLVMHEPASQAVDAKAMLDHFCEQTGLTWTEEMRPVNKLMATVGQ